MGDEIVSSWVLSFFGVASLGIALVAINFSAWVVALWLLMEPASQW